VKQKPSALKSWLVVFSIYLCCGLPVMVSPVIQILSEEYSSVPLDTIRTIVTIPSLMSFALAIFLASWVGKKFSYRTALLTALVLNLIGGVLPAFLNRSFAMILAARVVYSVGFGFFSMRNAFTNHFFGDENAAVWMGYGMFIQNAASVLLQLVSGRLGDLNWRYSFLLYFVIAAALAIAFLLYREDPGDRKETGAEQGRGGIVLPPLRTAVYALIPLLGTLCIFPILSSASVFIHERGMGTASESSVVVAAHTIGSAVFSVFFGRVFRRLGRWTVSAGCAVSAVGFALILASSNVVMMAAGTFCTGAGFSWVLLACTNWAKDGASHEQKAVAMTLVTSFVSGGAFLSGAFMSFARWAGASIPLFTTELEKTFLVSVLVYIVMGAAAAVFDLRPARPGT